MEFEVKEIKGWRLSKSGWIELLVDWGLGEESWESLKDIEWGVGSEKGTVFEVNVSEGGQKGEPVVGAVRQFMQKCGKIGPLDGGHGSLTERLTLRRLHQQLELIESGVGLPGSKPVPGAKDKRGWLPRGTPVQIGKVCVCCTCFASKEGRTLNCWVIGRCDGDGIVRGRGGGMIWLRQKI